MPVGSPWAHAMQFKKKTTGKMAGWRWLLHHDSAPAHTSHHVQQFLAKHGTVFGRVAAAAILTRSRIV